MLAVKFPRDAELITKTGEDDVLAFRHFPPSHWRKLWSTNQLEQFNEEIKRRIRIVGIFPNHASIVRLIGEVMLEQDEHWQLEGRRMFSQGSIAAISPGPEAPPRQRRRPKQSPETTLESKQPIDS